jgi:hypothetical protein
MLVLDAHVSTSHAVLGQELVLCDHVGFLVLLDLGQNPEQSTQDAGSDPRLTKHSFMCIGVSIHQNAGILQEVLSRFHP